MGLSYRKRKKIAPGLTFTLSSRSAGLSAGVRGARVSTNTRGRSFLSLAFRGLMFRRRIR
jgi:hypothetical protein